MRYRAGPVLPTPQTLQSQAGELPGVSWVPMWRSVSGSDASLIRFATYRARWPPGLTGSWSFMTNYSSQQFHGIQIRYTNKSDSGYSLSRRASSTPNGLAPRHLDSNAVLGGLSGPGRSRDPAHQRQREVGRARRRTRSRNWPPASTRAPIGTSSRPRDSADGERRGHQAVRARGSRCRPTATRGDCSHSSATAQAPPSPRPSRRI